MQLTCTDLEDEVRKIDLAGRMDIEGANAIDLRVTTLVVSGGHRVVVDLSGVEFSVASGA